MNNFVFVGGEVMVKAKIGDVCEVLNGFAFKSENYSSSGIRIIRIANVQKGYVEDTDPAFYPEDSVGLEKYMLKSGDLLMSLTGNVGRVALLDKKFLPAALNQRVACLRMKRSDVLLEYVFHYLNSDLFEQKCITSAKGVAQKNMSTEWLKDCELPIVSIDKQQYVVNRLNLVLAVIDARKGQLSALDTLIKARFVEMFGEPAENSKKLPTLIGQDFFKLSNGKFVPEPKRFTSGIPSYGGNGISWYTDDVLCQDDTIVVGRVGFQSGNVHLAHGPMWITDNAMFISTYKKNEYDLVFLYYLMDLVDFSRYQDAGDLKKITQKPFMSFEYIHPELTQQQAFAAFVAQVDKSKAVVQKALDEAQTLFDSLMQQYFG